MADVQILGAGWAGLSVALHLRARGASVRVVDPRGLLGGASGRALGIALPCPPEHPHRLEAALGTERAAALVAFTLDSLRSLPGFQPVGVRWRAAGAEVGELPGSIAAARRLGLRVTSTDDGFHLEDGGFVDLAALHGALRTEVFADPAPAEITVHATGCDTALGWLADKIMPVRWQAVHFEGPRLACPVVSQHATVAWCGALDAVGARWATPHMEVGEREERPSPAVGAMLERLTRGMFPEAGVRGREWAGITGESCDALPIVGPVPGRPRDVACVGFGFHGLPMAWGAARAIAAGLLDGDMSGVPPSLRVSRFQ